MNTAEAKVPNVEGDWQSIEIFLFSNGQENSPPRKYHLRAEDLNFWDDTLSNLALLHYGLQHPLIYLYTTDGHLVEGPLELKDGVAYVAVAPPDEFIDAGYEKYLIKASRSWEKRQTRKNNSGCQNNQPCCLCPEIEGYKQNVIHCVCPEKQEYTTEYKHNVIDCTCPEKEDCLYPEKEEYKHNVRYCLCPEKEVHGGSVCESKSISEATAEHEQYVMAATEQAELRSPAAYSVLAKCTPGSLADEYGPRSGDGGARQGERGARSSDPGSRPGELEHRSAENGTRMGEQEPRSVERGDRLGKSGARTAERESSLDEPTSNPGGRPKGRPDEYESRAGEHGKRPFEYEVGLADHLVSEQGGREIETGGRGGDLSNRSVDYGERRGEPEMRAGEQRDSDHGSKPDEQRGTDSELGGRVDNSKGRGGEQRSRDSDYATSAGEQRSRDNDYGARPGEQRGRNSDVGGRVDHSKEREGEHELRAGEQRRRESDYTAKADEQKGRDNDHGTRPGEQKGKDSDVGSRVDDSKGRGGEQELRAGEQRGRASEQRGKVSDRKGRGAEHELRAGEQRGRENNYAARAGEQRGKNSEYGGRVSNPGGREVEHGVRSVEQRGRGNSLGAKFGDPVSRANPGASVGDQGARLGVIGTRINPAARVGAPGARINPGAKAEEPGTRGGDGVGSGVAGLPYIPGLQHVRRFSISAENPPTEKKRWSTGQRPTLKKPTPNQISPVQPKKTEDKKSIKNSRENPTKKVPGKAPSSEAPSNEVGKPKIVTKFPKKRFADPAVPPATANFVHPNIKRKSTSLTKITSNHITTDSARDENSIGDKEIIVISPHLIGNPESETNSMRLDGVKDFYDEKQTEQRSLHQSITSIPVNEGVQTYPEQLAESTDKNGQGVFISGKLKVTCSPSCELLNKVEIDNPDNNYISITNKGDVINLKLNIEIRNVRTDGRPVNSCQKTCRRSRSVTNIMRIEKGSQINIEEDMYLQSKSLQSLVNNEYFRGSGCEDRTKVVMVQCSCCAEMPNNPPQCDPTLRNDSKKYFILLPNPQQENIDEGCTCGPACQIFQPTYQQQSKKSIFIPVKKNTSEMSLEIITAPDMGVIVTTTNSTCQTEGSKSDLVSNKHNMGVTKDPPMRCNCNCQRRNSSQISEAPTQFILPKNSGPQICPPQEQIQFCLQICPPQEQTQVPQVNSQRCSHICPQVCPPQEQTQVFPQICPPQKQTQVCLEVKAKRCSQGCPQVYPQLCPPQEQTQGCPPQEQTHVCPQVKSQGCSQLCPKVSDSSTQTECCSLLHSNSPGDDCKDRVPIEIANISSL